MARGSFAHMLCGLVAVTGLGGCTRGVPDRPITAAVEPAPPVEAHAASAAVAPADAVDPSFVPLMEAAYARHAGWGRVDDELRWSPFLCRMPMPATPHMSRAEEGGHARKLYSLFARRRDRYVGVGPPGPGARLEIDAGAAAPEPFVGQVVVKASYVPERVAPDAGVSADAFTVQMGFDGDGDHFHPVTVHDGVTYRAGAVAGYYVVAEVPKGTPGSDDGFVYGTLTANGQVTSAGRVASCMGCHVEAKNGRLFGRAPR